MLEYITIESSSAMEILGSGDSGATVAAMDTSCHKTKRHHMDGPSARVHLDNNSSRYNLFNLIRANMRSEMEGDGRKGDGDRTKYIDITPSSRE